VRKILDWEFWVLIQDNATTHRLASMVVTSCAAGGATEPKKLLWWNDVLAHFTGMIALHFLDKL
jgi:hypothetical protein